MTNAKALYAALAAVITALALNLLPVEGLDDVQHHIRLLVEAGIHATVQSLAVYWTAWWATNAPETPQ